MEDEVCDAAEKSRGVSAKGVASEVLVSRSVWNVVAVGGAATGAASSSRANLTVFFGASCVGDGVVASVAGC